MKASPGLPVLLLLVVAGCGSTQRTVGEGAFQKRRLQPGWHWDLGLRANAHTVRRSQEPAPSTPRTWEPDIPSGSPIAAATEPLTVLGDRPTVFIPNTAGNRRLPSLAVAETQPTEAALPSTTVEPKARWNPWAVPSFVLALATVAYALLGVSEIIAVLAVIATLVVASVAVRKGRTYEWRGKGFAIAALMIGSLAALITLIALLAA